MIRSLNALFIALVIGADSPACSQQASPLIFRDAATFLDKCSGLIDSPGGILDIDNAVQRLGSPAAGILCLSPLTLAWVQNVCGDNEPVTGEVISYLAMMSKLLGARIGGIPLDGQISYALAAGDYCRLRNQANQTQSEPLFQELRRVVQGGNPAFARRARYVGPSWEKALPVSCAKSITLECAPINGVVSQLATIKDQVLDRASPKEMGILRFDPYKPDALTVRGYDAKPPAVAIVTYNVGTSRKLHAIFRSEPKACIAALVLEHPDNGTKQVNRVADVIGPFAECGVPIVRIAR